jgi:hypothetical protein
MTLEETADDPEIQRNDTDADEPEWNRLCREGK